MEPKPTSDESAAPRQRSVAERRMHLEQALASTRIEGHQPSAEFLADMQAMVDGQLSDEEVRRRIIERARAADRRAMNATSERAEGLVHQPSTRARAGQTTRPTWPAIPERQIRAVYDEHTIRVYQAYSDEIAESALKHGTFVSPPFKMERMTWIKPSFLWMMYRAGWGLKDDGQKRILAIDITREGFEWALAHSCPSHRDPTLSDEEWQQVKTKAPVRIQWDPERDINLQPLPHRTIQIGLSGLASKLYKEEWICSIVEITELACTISKLVRDGKLCDAKTLLPFEHEFNPIHQPTETDASSAISK